MANVKFSALGSMVALAAADLLVGLQGGVALTATAAQIKTFCSASPVLVTPNLGTPTAGVLTSCTGLPPAGVVGTAAILGANTFTATQTINPAANTNALAVSGYSVTGSGTTPMVSLAGTWNTSGVVSAFVLNMTNTASGVGSAFADFQIAGTSAFLFGKPGTNVGGLTMVSGADTIQILANNQFYSSIVTNNSLWLKANGGPVAVGTQSPGAGAITSLDPNGLNFTRRSITGGRHCATISGTTQGTFLFNFDDQTTDNNCVTLAVIGNNAFTTAVTNITGGGVSVTGGAGSASSAGAAHGGDLTLSGGQGFGTGHYGRLILLNIPTSSAGLPTGGVYTTAGALMLA